METELMSIDKEMATEFRRLSKEWSKALGRKVTIVDVTRILLPGIKGRPLTLVHGKLVIYKMENDGRERIRLDELHI